MKTSVLGAINVLGLAKRCRAKVLQASTSEVYGDPEVHPQPEDVPWIGQSRSVRGPATTKESGRPKRCSSTTIVTNRVNVRIVRIFNTYGPRMHPYDGRVVSNFIRQALARRRHHDLWRRVADAFVSATATIWSRESCE